MTKDKSQPVFGTVETVAAHWFQAIKEDPEARHHPSFVKWLNASPRHIEELLKVKQVDDRLRDFFKGYSMDVDILVERAKQEQQRRAKESARIKKTALSMLVVGVLALGFVLVPPSKETFVTRDETKMLDLDDGSKVTLKAESKMQVVFSKTARDLYLKGQGNFQVQRDEKRPFRVHAGPAIVEAVGTQFDVHAAANQTDVAVLEGVVQLKPGDSAGSAVDGVSIMDFPTVIAGQSVTVYPDGRAEWRRLIFKNDPLAKIAAEFNRLNTTPQFKIEGARLRERRSVFVFHNSQPESLLNDLEQDKTLEITREGNDIIVRERHP